MENDEITRYLAEIKLKGQSSPAGQWWDEFYSLLQKYASKKSAKLKMPLILAAARESNSSKHFRLSEQLYWAAENGCLEQAFSYLNNLSADKWNTGKIENWNKSYH